MMSLFTSHHTLINRGRKAGLTTRELYSAMSGRPPEAGANIHGPADSNGYVASIDTRGQRIYRPVGSYPRP